MKKFLYSGLVTMIVGGLGLAVWLVFSFGDGRQGAAPTMAGAIAEADLWAQVPENIDAYEDGFFVSSSEDAIVLGPPRILPHTRMVYDYYNTNFDGNFETITEYPAYFLLDMTQDEVERLFADWQVLSFSFDEVHLRQNAQAEYRQFIIGTHEGYIAVFYDDDYSIKELTGRPIAALAAEEQQRLREGIRVTGIEELMRALEDFGS